MKKYLLLCIMLFMAICAKSQTNSIEGDWYGMLDFQVQKLEIVFRFQTEDGKLTVKMDSPSQKVYSIPATFAKYENEEVTVIVDNLHMKFNGRLENGEIVGTFIQGGNNIPLTLSTKKAENVEINRPQTPKPPFPYYTEEVSFKNPSANITLGGTLSLPSKDGKYPVVVFITGSGVQNRDEEICDHKPFLVISDYLVRHGIATLRFDDRGVGQSSGNQYNATTFDFATDVESAVTYLKTRKEIDGQRIGLLGHSEGALIASIVASESKDIHFIVSMAGPGVRGDKLILMQNEYLLRASNEENQIINQINQINSDVFNIILTTTDTQKLTDKVRKCIREFFTQSNLIPENVDKEAFIQQNIDRILLPWMVSYVRIDPTDYLKKIKCAYLAINGELDVQVPYKENLEAIQNTFLQNRNKGVTIKSFANMNHMFQTCQTGLPFEYAQIEQTISPEILKYVTRWILDSCKN